MGQSQGQNASGSVDQLSNDEEEGEEPMPSTSFAGRPQFASPPPEVDPPREIQVQIPEVEANIELPSDAELAGE